MTSHFNQRGTAHEHLDMLRKDVHNGQSGLPDMWEAPAEVRAWTDRHAAAAKGEEDRERIRGGEAQDAQRHGTQADEA